MNDDSIVTHMYCHVLSVLLTGQKKKKKKKKKELLAPLVNMIKEARKNKSVLFKMSQICLEEDVCLYCLYAR